MAKLVTFEQFNPSNLTGSEPIPKEIQTDKGAVKYNDIKLSYNYGTPSDPIINDLFLELPEVDVLRFKYTEEPATGKNGPYTKKTAAMMISFDLTDPATRNDTQSALDKLDGLHLAASQCIGTYKGKLKMHSFDAANPGSSFGNPVYWQRDDASGLPIKGTNPSLWVNLKCYSGKTLFTDLNGQVVDWKLLENTNIKMLPLIHIEKIFVGIKVTLKIHLASAIILKIIPAGSESRQTSTMDRLKAKYGGLADQVEAQLADLRMSRQDTLNTPCVPSSHTEFGSDYASEKPSMHSMPSEDFQETDSSASIQDFLSGAPSMATSQVNLPPVSTSSAPALKVQTMKIN